jgi:hypothetical protein
MIGVTRCTVGMIAVILIAFGYGFANDGAIIHIDYPGIAIFLDENEILHSGPDSIRITPGAHRITLYFPARESQWLPPILSRPFELKENERLVISEESIRYLNITTTPSGAEIHLDGRLSGVTPLSISLMPTDRTIQLKKRGYRDSVVDLERIRGRSSNLIRVLDPLTPTGDEIDARMDTGELDRPWPNWISYTTLGYFITSTALGFYNKSRADDMYDEYLRTSSRQEMNRLFDRANTLDNRARIFWITGQVALGTTIYLLIRNYRIRSVERPLPSLGFDLTGDRGGGVYLTFTFGKEEGPGR